MTRGRVLFAYRHDNRPTFSPSFGEMDAFGVHRMISDMFPRQHCAAAMRPLMLSPKRRNNVTFTGHVETGPRPLQTHLSDVRMHW